MIRFLARSVATVVAGNALILTGLAAALIVAEMVSEHGQPLAPSAPTHRIPSSWDR